MVWVNSICEGVQDGEHSWDGVAILLEDMWYGAVVEFGCVRPGMQWVKLTFSRIKVCWLL